MFLFPLSFLLEALLQWWLSGRKNRFLGWILPALHIVLSIVLILSLSAYTFSGASYSVSSVVTLTDDEMIAVEDDGNSILVLEETAAEETEAIPDSDGRGSIGIIGGADGPTSIFVSGSTDWPMLILAFLMLNIPTAVLIVIYIIQRSRIRRNTLNKTIIQDL